MFCSSCGKPDQAENGYCRACGEFLADPSRSGLIAFGGKTPQQNVNAINILSVLAAIASILAAVWMYVTQFSVPVALYFGAAMLICNAIWHLSNFSGGMKLRRRFGEAKDTSNAIDESLPVPKTHELLPKMNQQDILPASVTEKTTSHLGEEIIR